MPFLKREPELFPEDVLALSTGEYPWWVAHTQSARVEASSRTRPCSRDTFSSEDRRLTGAPRCGAI